MTTSPVKGLCVCGSVYSDGSSSSPRYVAAAYSNVIRFTVLSRLISSHSSVSLFQTPSDETGNHSLPDQAITSGNLRSVVLDPFVIVRVG
jgi:hypothetical protein